MNGWMLIIALMQPGEQYLDKVVVGPFRSEPACKMARVEGIDQLQFQRVCVSVAQWDGVSNGKEK